MSNQEGEHKARGVRSKTNQLEKTAPKRKTTTSGPKIKIPQVKTKRWVQKKNGLFGWVTSIVEKKQSAPREVPPHDVLAGGGGSKIHPKNKQNIQTMGGGPEGLPDAAGLRKAMQVVESESELSQEE